MRSAQGSPARTDLIKQEGKGVCFSAKSFTLHKFGKDICTALSGGSDCEIGRDPI